MACNKFWNIFPTLSVLYSSMHPCNSQIIITQSDREANKACIDIKW